MYSGILQERHLDEEISTQIPERKYDLLGAEFREFSKESSDVGVIAQSIEKPREQFEQQSVSLQTANRIRLVEKMGATQHESMDQPVMLEKNDKYESLQHVVAEKQVFMDVARVKAIEEHLVATGVNRSKQEQCEGGLIVLTDKNKQESALRSKESTEEAVSVMSRTVETELGKEITLGSRALEIERAVKDVAATCDTVAEALCELHATPSGHAAKVFDDYRQDSETRRLGISERRHSVELKGLPQNADVVGKQAYFHEDKQSSVHREFSNKETMHMLSMSRIKSPRSDSEYSEVTRQIAKTLSLDQRFLEATEDIAEIKCDIAAEMDHAQTFRNVVDIQKAMSVGCLKATSEERTNLDWEIARSDQELRAHRQLRAIDNQALSSQSYKEFVSEVKGLTTHWDVIETDQAALICWKDADQQSSKLLTKAVTNLNVGTTLDLTVRRPERHENLEIPLGAQDSAVLRLSVDDAQTSFSLQRSASESHAKHTAADVMKLKNYEMFHEFGKDEVATFAAFGKLQTRQVSQEHTTKSMPDVRNFAQTYSTLASMDFLTSSDCSIQKEDEEEHSMRLITIVNQEQLHESLLASKDAEMSSSLKFQRLDDTGSADIAARSRVTSQHTCRLFEPRNELASSHYGTHTNEYCTTQIFAIDNKEQLEVALCGSKDTNVQSSINVERDHVSQLAHIHIPDKKHEKEGRKFQVQMVKSERHLERHDDEEKLESVRTSAIKELASAKYHEYGDKETQICTLFGKIVQKKHEIEEVERSIPSARGWLEQFKCNASGDRRAEVTVALQEISKSSENEKVFRMVNGSRVVLSLKASTSESVTTSSSHSKSGHKEDAAVKLRSRSKERVEKKLLAQVWNLQSTSSEWQSILRDLEAEITKAEVLHERYNLITKAPSTTDATTERQIYKEQTPVGVTKSISTASVEKELRSFSIDREDRVIHFEHFSKDFAEIEKLVDEINKESGIQESFKEYGRAKCDSGITLIRRTLPRSKETCNHVVSISASLQQVFATQAASDDRREAIVAVTLPSPSMSVEMASKIHRKERASLCTKHSTNTMVNTSANYHRCNDRISDVMVKREHFMKEKSCERLREAEDGMVEILSKWEGVERDLETEVVLPKKVDMKFSLAAFETSEEVVTLTKAMILPEESLYTLIVKRIVPFVTISRQFSVEEHVDESTLSRKASETFAIEIVLPEKMLGKGLWRLKECGDAKFSAVINLHKFELKKPTQLREICLHDKICISAQPLYIKANAVESDVIWSNHTISKTLDQYTASKKINAANSIPSVEVKMMESSDEKIRLTVELLGTKGGMEAVIVEWPVPNRAEQTKLETEEYGDENAVSFAQINCRQVLYEDVEYTQAIPRTSVLLLRTTESKEKEEMVSADWFIKSQHEYFDKLICICNRDTNAHLSCLESTEESVAVGLTYGTVPLLAYASHQWRDKRFGGNYCLKTRSPTTEDKMAVMALIQRIQSETIHHKQIQRSRLEVSSSISAAKAENITVNFNYEKTFQMESIRTTKPCANESIPQGAHFAESLQEFASTYFDFVAKKSSYVADKTYKIPQTLEGDSFACEAAEDNHVQSNPCMSRDAQFAVVSLVIKDCNKTQPASVETFAPTSLTISLATCYTRVGEKETLVRIYKDVNRGINVVITVRECRDEKHTLYHQYERESHKENIVKIFAIPWSGGKFQLKSDASEEHEIIITRELQKVREVVMHCESRIVIAHTTSPQQLTSKATTSESTTIDRVWKRDDIHYSTSKKIIAKNSESAKLRVEESAEFVENIHPIFNRSNEKFDLDRTIYIPRHGGSSTLKTKAASELLSGINVDVVKPVVNECHANIAFTIANSCAPIELHGYSSKTANLDISQDLCRLSDREVAQKILVAANRGVPATFVAMESTEISVISTTNLRRSDAMLREATLISDKRYGGAITLSTRASSSVSSTMAGILLCPRSSNLSATKVVVIGNGVTPAKLFTLASTSETRVVDRDWTRQASQYTISKKLASPNNASSSVTLKEAGDNHEVTNCACRRDADREEIEKTIREKRKGSAVSLNTKYSRECSSDSDDTLVAATRLALVHTEKIVFVANSAPKASLSTSAASCESHSVNEDWHRPESHEAKEVILKKPHAGDHTRLLTNETSDVVENIILQLYKKDSKEETGTTKFIAFTVAPATLSSKASGESIAIVERALQSVETFELNALIVITDQNTIEGPNLTCECSKEASTSGVFDLSRLGDAQLVREIRKAANSIQAVIKEMRESQLLSQSSNLFYERDQSTAFISETFLIPREGGKFVLSTAHAGQETVFVNVDYTKERQDLLDVTFCKVLRNEAQPAEVFASATKDCAIDITSHLQKSSQFEGTSTKRDTRNVGEPATMTIYESTFVDEIVNVCLRHEDNLHEIESAIKSQLTVVALN
ncbi:hypothetical protein KIN20_003778 [Parelaphostrongylus tenuis]|uniref:Uncharacterized protein n=1 Tax=Parelaphostrongylus tenuis TaxID=148309 RepID=A0AAD5QHL2_PARTN|nr:hypothetical protein KIN20_003778 [Parelaphostrongylus tenuis]